jgi:hypothetical protein
MPKNFSVKELKILSPPAKKKKKNFKILAITG